MQHVAKDCNFEPLEFPCVFFDRVEIEKSLRWMRMCAVSRIDNDGRNDGCRIGGGSFRLVSHDDGIHAHRLDRVERIAQTLPLDNAGCS